MTPAAPTTADGRPQAKQEIAVPPGRLVVGSRPGTAHRNPGREAEAVPMEVPGFGIDALPYPNDPAQPVRAALSRTEAAQLCEAEGKRLCHELEWERACKGDEQREYPSAPFDAVACAKTPGACLSPFGVAAMGALGREWTASDAQPGLGDAMRTAVVRGAAPDAAGPLHRCAARDAATPDSKGGDLVFRCCRGPVLGAIYPSEPAVPVFREQELDIEQLRRSLAVMPETEALARSFQPFGAEQIKKRLDDAQPRPKIAPWTVSTKPLEWSPVSGERLIVTSGDSAEGAALVAWYAAASGPVIAATYVTRNEHAPILVAYRPDSAKQVLFSTCWGCGGEGGALEYGDDARLKIAPR